MVGRFAQTLRMQWEAGTFTMRWVLPAASQARSVPALRLHQTNSACEGPAEKILSGCLWEGRALLQINSDVSEKKAFNDNIKLGRELPHINGNQCLCAHTLESNDF